MIDTVVYEIPRKYKNPEPFSNPVYIFTCTLECEKIQMNEKSNNIFFSLYSIVFGRSSLFILYEMQSFVIE